MSVNDASFQMIMAIPSRRTMIIHITFGPVRQVFHVTHFSDAIGTAGASDFGIAHFAWLRQRLTNAIFPAPQVIFAHRPRSARFIKFFVFGTDAFMAQSRNTSGIVTATRSGHKSFGTRLFHTDEAFTAIIMLRTGIADDRLPFGHNTRVGDTFTDDADAVTTATRFIDMRSNHARRLKTRIFAMTFVVRSTRRRLFSFICAWLFRAWLFIVSALVIASDRSIIAASHTKRR